MRNYEQETAERVSFIRHILAQSGAKGLVFGSSGGKDSALVGILCKLACENTLGVILPCESKRNFEEDKNDALSLAAAFQIEHITIDLTDSKAQLKKVLSKDFELNDQADINIAPRLRMTALYAIAASKNYLVAGTGNLSESYMGYFTKWGDGACDFNPISDLTAGEVFQFLKHLSAPEVFYEKSPSAGLFEGQTDESEMGVSYAEIDEYLLQGKIGENFAKIDKAHRITQHKRQAIAKFRQ